MSTKPMSLWWTTMLQIYMLLQRSWTDGHPSRQLALVWHQTGNTKLKTYRTNLILRTTHKHNASGDGCRLDGGTGRLTIGYITEGHMVRAAKKAWPHPAWLLAFHSELHCQYLTGWGCTALLSWLQEPGWNMSSVTSPLPTKKQHLVANKFKLIQ